MGPLSQTAAERNILARDLGQPLNRSAFRLTRRGGITGHREAADWARRVRDAWETLFIGQTYIDVDLSARYGDPALHFVAS